MGIPVIYLFGAVQMKVVTNQPWPAIMVQAVLPFIPLDVVKCFVAAGLAKILRPCCTAVLKKQSTVWKQGEGTWKRYGFLAECEVLSV